MVVEECFILMIQCFKVSKHHTPDVLKGGDLKLFNSFQIETNDLWSLISGDVDLCNQSCKAEMVGQYTAAFLPESKEWKDESFTCVVGDDVDKFDYFAVIKMHNKFPLLESTQFHVKNCDSTFKKWTIKEMEVYDDFLGACMFTDSFQMCMPNKPEFRGLELTVLWYTVDKCDSLDFIKDGLLYQLSTDETTIPSLLVSQPTILEPSFKNECLFIKRLEVEERVQVNNKIINSWEPVNKYSFKADPLTSIWKNKGRTCTSDSFYPKQDADHFMYIKYDYTRDTFYDTQFVVLYEEPEYTKLCSDPKDFDWYIGEVGLKHFEGIVKFSNLASVLISEMPDDNSYLKSYPPNLNWNN